VVGRFSRYTGKTSREYWTALDRVFRYLMGIIGYCLTYTGYPNVMKDYSDTNWVTDFNSVKSTTGYVFYIWRSYCVLKILQTNSDCLERHGVRAHCSGHNLL